jgi:hypothetical protein
MGVDGAGLADEAGWADVAGRWASLAARLGWSQPICLSIYKDAAKAPSVPQCNIATVTDRGH